MIKLVGLSGFEGAFPYQMSGGMQQRCGLARALAIEPSVLLMDEPFAAVDAQTREILQFELLRIWEERPTAMIFVTHSIEEAVLLGHRVIVLKGRPSSIHETITIDLPGPRTRETLRDAALCRAARARLEHADERSARGGIPARTYLTNTMTTDDPRLQAAVSHWGARFVANGVALTDFEDVTRSITSYDEWCAAWSSDSRGARRARPRGDGKEEVSDRGRDVSSAPASTIISPASCSSTTSRR